MEIPHYVRDDKTSTRVSSPPVNNTRVYFHLLDKKLVRKRVAKTMELGRARTSCYTRASPQELPNDRNAISIKAK